MTTTKPFWVEIEWGGEWSGPKRSPDPACRYEFATEAEYLAFMDGVDAANGWMDYEIMKDFGTCEVCKHSSEDVGPMSSNAEHETICDECLNDPDA